MLSRCNLKIRDRLNSTIRSLKESPLAPDAGRECTDIEYYRPIPPSGYALSLTPVALSPLPALLLPLQFILTVTLSCRARTPSVKYKMLYQTTRNEAVGLSWFDQFKRSRRYAYDCNIRPLIDVAFPANARLSVRT